jgi:rhodanese-related sulfurtransferase
MVAGWLRQLGHEAYVLEEGASAAADSILDLRGGMVVSEVSDEAGARSDAGRMKPQELAAELTAGTAQVIDLRSSMEFRKGHIPGAIWSIRPRIVAAADRNKTTVLIVGEADQAVLAAMELVDAGIRNLRDLAGGFRAWRDAGLPVDATPDNPPDLECIDFLFFTARRHDNDPEAARQYLAWETGLLGQLDAQERGVFRIS